LSPSSSTTSNIGLIVIGDIITSEFLGRFKDFKVKNTAVLAKGKSRQLLIPNVLLIKALNVLSVWWFCLSLKNTDIKPLSRIE
jgi:hypothetical protein